MSNILVVDDKSDNVYYLTALLSAHGHTVSSARNGREALEYSYRTAPDLIISDLLMPVMDGYTLLRNWKSDPALRNIGFVIYTATYISPEDERMAKELGADAFIVKPADPDFVMEQIDRILARTERNSPTVPPEKLPDTASVGEYSANLVRKLEAKTIELEAVNRSLRTEIEERTRISNTRDAILDSLPAHIALLDHMGTIVAVNSSWVAFAEQTGCGTMQSFVGSNYFRVCETAAAGGLQDARRVSDGLRAVLAGKSPSFSTEYPCITDQGTLWYRVIVSPMNQPQTNGVVVTHFNVTDVKAAEESSRRTSERLSMALDAAAIGIWEWAPDEPMIWDDRMYDLYGIARGEPMDFARWSRVVHPDDVETPAEVMERIAAAGGRREHQFRIILPSGEVRHIFATEKLISAAGGTRTAYVGTNMDITARHQLEEQLRQSQRLEAVGKMTGGVAHDFNNLLTVIIGNGEMLEDALGNAPRLRKMAEMIVAAADRGTRLSSQLLAFSRRQMLAPRAVNVNDLLVRLEALLSRAVGGKVDVELRSSPDVWPALIDASELENAVLNLSVNARDAMPEGGRLLIETDNVMIDAHDAVASGDLQKGDYVRIRVTDTGFGMDEKTRLRAFDPFFTTKDVGKGSGLGLSMVYGFVKQSHGHINLISEPGHGTTVELLLPRSNDAELQLIEIDERAEPPGGRETILVVEDDDDLRLQVSAQLMDLGYQVINARDGREALKIIEMNRDCDLLFTDVVMPKGMSGQQLAVAARQIRPELAVLFTTGFVDESHQQTMGMLDPNAVLRKPYRRRELADMVRKALDELA